MSTAQLDPCSCPLTFQPKQGFPVNVQIFREHLMKNIRAALRPITPDRIENRMRFLRSGPFKPTPSVFCLNAQEKGGRVKEMDSLSCSEDELIIFYVTGEIQCSASVCCTKADIMLTVRGSVWT